MNPESQNGMEMIRLALANVFPGSDVNALTLDTKLSSIPEWDSMNAVNLVMELESLGGVKNLGLQFSSEMTISQIIEALRARGVNV